MNRRVLVLCVIAALALAGVSVAAAGQEKVERSFAYRVGSDGPGGGQIDFQFSGPDGPMVWMMMGDGKTVKGAPYSAQAMNESIQTLPDGNRIVRKTTSALYRDSEGRTRREDSAKPNSDDQRTVFINDPVAGISYFLNTREKTAHKMPGGGFNLTWKSGDGNPAEKTVTVNGKTETKTEIRSEVHTFEKEVVIDGHGGPGVMVHSGSGEFHEARKGQKESLGKQMFDGVEAEGTRTTVTIPAGEIGNEQPINIVSERWYSPELQVTVMTRHSDPRFGETTYRLTNINRSEPARSLFELPSDYTVSTPGSMMNMKKRAAKPQDQ